MFYYLSYMHGISYSVPNLYYSIDSTGLFTNLYTISDSSAIL